MRKCEYRDIDATEACGFRARFRVTRIGRKFDAQDSCRCHLAATCTALEEGDGTLVTVEHIREG